MARSDPTPQPRHVRSYHHRPHGTHMVIAFQRERTKPGPTIVGEDPRLRGGLGMNYNCFGRYLAGNGLIWS